MSKLAQDVRAARVHRDAVRAAFDQRAAAVKADLAAKGVGARIVDDMAAKASAGVAKALDVADAHRGVIAGTIAALALWFLRRPLISLALAQYEKWARYRASHKD